MSDRYTEGWRACRWEAARVALDHSSWMNPIGVRIKEAILALPDPPAPAAEADARAEAKMLRDYIGELNSQGGGDGR